MYYSTGGTFLEKEVEYPSLRVSPEVNCNQFTFHTITLSSTGACEVSTLIMTAAGRQVCQFLFFPRSKKKQIPAAYCWKCGNQNPTLQFSLKTDFRCY